MAQQVLRRRRVAVVQQQQLVALRRQGDQLVHHHQRAPEVAEGVEGDAVRKAAQVRGAEQLAVAQRHALRALPHPHAGDVRAGGLDDVEPLFTCVEPDLVGEVKALGHHAQHAALQHGDVAVAHARAGGRGPRVHAGGNGDPHAVLRIAQHEVHLADRLAVDAVHQRAGGAFARHQFQAVGAEVADEDVAVGGKGQPVGQRAGGELALHVLAGGGRGAGEARVRLLPDEALAAVGGDARHAAARVGRPQRAIGLGQDAFGPLQAVADGLDAVAVDAETLQGVGHVILQGS